jgi:hypothetical protein
MSQIQCRHARYHYLQSIHKASNMLPEAKWDILDTGVQPSPHTNTHTYIYIYFFFAKIPFTYQLAHMDQ